LTTALGSAQSVPVKHHLLRAVAVAVGVTVLLAGCSSSQAGDTGKLDTVEVVEARLVSSTLADLMTAKVREYSSTLDLWLNPQPGTFDELLAARRTGAVQIAKLFTDLSVVKESVELPPGTTLKETLDGSPLFTEIRNGDMVRCIMPGGNKDGYMFVVQGGECALAPAERLAYDWQVRFIAAATAADTATLEELMYENLGFYLYNAYTDLYRRAAESERGDMLAVSAGDVEELEKLYRDDAVSTDVDVSKRTIITSLVEDRTRSVCITVPAALPEQLPSLSDVDVSRNCR